MIHLEKNDWCQVSYVERQNAYDGTSLIYVTRFLSFGIACRDVRFYTCGDSWCYSDMLSSMRLT